MTFVNGVGYCLVSWVTYTLILNMNKVGYEQNDFRVSIQIVVYCVSLYCIRLTVSNSFYKWEMISVGKVVQKITLPFSIAYGSIYGIGIRCLPVYLPEVYPSVLEAPAASTTWYLLRIGRFGCAPCVGVEPRRRYGHVTDALLPSGCLLRDRIIFLSLITLLLYLFLPRIFIVKFSVICYF